MDINKIMDVLIKEHIWSDYNHEASVENTCPFCGGDGMVVIKHPLYGYSGAYVKCRRCGTQGPRASIYALILAENGISTPLLEESLAHGINAALDAWNSRTADCSRLGNLRMEKSA